MKVQAQLWLGFSFGMALCAIGFGVSFAEASTPGGGGNWGVLEYVPWTIPAGNQVVFTTNNDATAPPLALDTDGNSGFYSDTDDVLRVTVAGTNDWLWSAGLFGAATSTGGGLRNEAATFNNPTVHGSRSDGDSGLTANAVDEPCITAGGVGAICWDEDDNLVQTEVYGGNNKGQFTGLHIASETLTFSADPGDASVTTTGLIPDGAYLVGVTTRVTTVATNCTSVNIGDGTDVNMFGATTGITQNTTTDNSDATAVFGHNPATAAVEVVITAVGANCFDGVWDVSAHYILPSAATSN